MHGVDSVAEEFASFAEWLSTERAASVERITRLQNGFEGWMKLEFFFWLTSVRSPALMAGPDEFDAGLEYKVSLDRRSRGMDRTTKQCDVWIRSSQRDWYHYVELKAPFLNGNTGKVIDSAASDFWYMSRLRRSYERAASGNAIVMGVGFGDTDWQRALERLRINAGLPEEFSPAGGGTIGRDDKIRWSILTRDYTKSEHG